MARLIELKCLACGHKGLRRIFGTIDGSDYECPECGAVFLLCEDKPISYIPSEANGLGLIE